MFAVVKHRVCTGSNELCPMRRISRNPCSDFSEVRSGHMVQNSRSKSEHKIFQTREISKRILEPKQILLLDMFRNSLISFADLPSLERSCCQLEKWLTHPLQLGKRSILDRFESAGAQCTFPSLVVLWESRDSAPSNEVLGTSESSRSMPGSSERRSVVLAEQLVCI